MAAWRRITVSLPEWLVARIEARQAAEKRRSRSETIAVLLERAILADEELGTVTVTDERKG